MGAKVLEDYQIQDIVNQKGKKTTLELAQQYHVHYRTIENYWKQHKPKTEKYKETKSYKIRIISTTPDKARNYIVDKIDYGRAKESKPRIGKFERQGSLEELMQAPNKIAEVKQCINNIEIGETIEVTLKVQVELKRKELQVHMAKVKQKNEHCIFVVFENGRIQSISDFELLTKETRIRKVG